MYRTLSVALFVGIAVSAQAQLTLPYAGTDSGATISSFQITKSGTAGRANTLYITNASNTSDVLLVNTVGLGRAAYFSITNPANSQIALRVDSNGTGTSMFGFMTGTGRAGFFRITNSSNASPALMAQTDGTGPGLRVLAGTGLAADIEGDMRINGASLNALQVFGGVNVSAGVTAAGFTGSGANLTLLNASNVSGGTLSDLRLSTNIPRLNSDNVFAGRIFAVGTLAGAPAFALSPGLGIYKEANGIGLATNSSARAVISANGQLGIGTTLPQRLLHVSSGNPPDTGVSNLVNMLLRSDTNAGLQVISGTDFSGRIIFGESTASTRVTLGVDASDGNLGIQLGGQQQLITALASSNFLGIAKLAPTTRLDVSGTVTGSAKNFLIDHPQDPYNKTLRHACVESDEYKNVYDGTVVTDARGYATVTMPDWFDALNQGFRYQLTVIDDGEDFVLAKVTREIESNRFTLRTSKPKVKVSWMVTGVRKDAYVRDNPLIVEQQKPANERGTLLHEGASPKRALP